MIGDEPDARGLIGAALAAYRDTVLPTVPSEERFAALMVANALGIALREIEAGERGERRLLEILADLAGTAVPQGPVGPAFADLSRGLCRRIAAGAFDEPAAEAALRRYLSAVTAERMAVSNPKRLHAAGGGTRSS